MENYVEDPLSEELLQGNFDGKNQVLVDAVRNDEGKMKHLKFEGTFVEPPQPENEEEPVGVGAGEATEEGNEGEAGE